MGRRPKLTPKQQVAVRKALELRTHTTRELAEMYGVAVVTIQQYLPPSRRRRPAEARVNLVGEKVGEWEVLEKVPRPFGLVTKAGYYRCLCSCGRVQVVLEWNLRSGRSQRCPSCSIRRARQVLRRQRVSNVPRETSEGEA